MSSATLSAVEPARIDPRTGLPRGTPSWITPQLVELTEKVWQPYYDEPLSVEDSITILRNAGRLFETLAARR